MVIATRNQGPTLDLDAPAYFDDPYAHYASLRDCAPVHRDPRGPWMVFRDDDVRFAVRHLSSRLANAPDTERTRRLEAVNRPRSRHVEFGVRVALVELGSGPESDRRSGCRRQPAGR